MASSAYHIHQREHLYGFDAGSFRPESLENTELPEDVFSGMLDTHPSYVGHNHFSSVDQEFLPK